MDLIYDDPSIEQVELLFEIELSKFWQDKIEIGYWTAFYARKEKACGLNECVEHLRKKWPEYSFKLVQGQENNGIPKFFGVHYTYYFHIRAKKKWRILQYVTLFISQKILRKK